MIQQDYLTLEKAMFTLTNKAIPEEKKESFLKMHVKDRLIGLATFARIAKDTEVLNSCMQLINAMEGIK